MPNLNRIATINASSTTTVNGFAPYAYADGYSDDLSAIGEWGVRDGADYLPTPTMVAELLVATVIELSQQSVFNTNLPMDESGLLAFVDDRGIPLLTWTIDSRATITDPFGQPKAYGYTVSDAMLLRDEPINSNLVYWGFGSQRIDVAETTVTGKRVWCEQLERGSSAGLLVLDGGTTDVEASTVTASFRLNYDPNFGNPNLIVDDLGREWQIFSVNTEDDRQYLRVDGSRAIIT